MGGDATVGDASTPVDPRTGALVIAVLAVVRSVLLDRAPQRALHGDEPIIGSLDTWPAVPRKPPH